ncbi:MAG: metallophosphoesterase [Gammaproteobacteria bacterium]|nr:metallophosphoesterase [Gammaproteobacteria bacterium]
MRFITFITVFLIVMAALNFYIYSRFLKKLSPAFSRYAAVIPIVLMIGNLFFMLDIVTGFIPDSPALYIVTSSFVGITFILFVVAVVYDLSITVSSKVPFDMERRKTIKIIFDVTMLIAALSYLLRGLSQGLKSPMVNPVSIKLDQFPIDRYSIVQLTDVHIGRTIRRDYIEGLVVQTNQLAPDLVVITGDLVDLPIEKIKQDLLPLAELDAPCYFILGNHEYFHGPEAILDFLRLLGIRPLLNDCVTIDHAQGRFNLLGINDQVGARLGMLAADIPRAYARVDPALPTIVLAHQPKTILQLDNYPCDLMLSGHTHGGQIFPFGLLVMMDQPYLAGLYRHAPDKQIFVSRGTGYWGPPIRLLSPSEISHIVLQPA